MHVSDQMATRVFALIIGVDKYKSGRIWNLESCVDDAKSVKRWLTHDLHVPRDQICLLLDSDATKRRIEDKFMSHLINNPAIEAGDAILIYFAGHGSRVRSPTGWYKHGLGEVEVLCPYDHDTRAAEGRIAGISDRSLRAMIDDLCRAKGDNITLMLDTCFSPLRSHEKMGQQHVRYTETVKATPNDLLTGLWRSATIQPGQKDSHRGFTGSSYASHVILAACGSQWVACEGKSGGNFTNALMTLKERVALHKLTYDDLTAEVSSLMGEHQNAVSMGRHTDRILFDGIPFAPDARYVSIDVYDDEKVRVEAGAIHGIMEGTEFTIHRHNHRGSLNPALALYSAIEVYPTWCLARCKSSARSAVQHGWARITRWNNRTPFRVHIRKSLFTLCRRFRLRKHIPSDAEQATAKPGMSMLRVKSAAQADISVQLRKRELVVERHDPVIASNSRRIIKLPSRRTSGDVKIVDDAARFHLHLHRKNPENPLLGLVSMELYRLDATSWERVSGNLLVNGKAEIVDDEKSSIYAVVLHNYSNYDLWPYLAYMDASGYGINMVHHPNPSTSKTAPLQKHSHMVIGSGTTESEALSFSLTEGTDVGAGFLKLFVSTTFTPMRFIEQGPATAAPTAQRAPIGRHLSDPEVAEMWDSLTACITVVRKVDKDG